MATDQVLLPRSLTRMAKRARSINVASGGRNGGDRGRNYKQRSSSGAPVKEITNSRRTERATLQRQRPRFSVGRRDASRFRKDEEIDSSEDEEGGEQLAGLDAQNRRRGASNYTHQSDEEASDGTGSGDDSDAAVGARGGSLEDKESDDDDLFLKETPEEARVRLAKQFLDRLGLSAAADKSVAEALESDARAAGRRTVHQVGHRVVPEEGKFDHLRFYPGHKDSVTCIALGVGSTAECVFTGSKDCSIIQWDLATGSKIRIFPGKRHQFHGGGHFAKVLDICMAPAANNAGGDALVTVGADRLVRIWDSRVAGGSQFALKGHTGTITGIACDPAEPESASDRVIMEAEGSQVYSSAADKSLRIWKIGYLNSLETLYGHVAAPTSIDLCVKDRPITGGEDQTVRNWKIASSTHLIYSGHSAPIDAVTAPNPTNIVSGSQDGELRLWGISSRRPFTVIKGAHGPETGVTALGCIRYSDTVFSGSCDGHIRGWQITKVLSKSEAVDKVAPGHSDNVTERHQNRRAGFELCQISNCTIPIKGFVNQIATSENGKILVAAIGKEHRLGRWMTIKDAKNGLLVVPLGSSSAVEDL